MALDQKGLFTCQINLYKRTMPISEDAVFDEEHFIAMGYFDAMKILPFSDEKPQNPLEHNRAFEVQPLSVVYLNDQKFSFDNYTNDCLKASLLDDLPVAIVCLIQFYKMNEAFSNCMQLDEYLTIINENISSAIKSVPGAKNNVKYCSFFDFGETDLIILFRSNSMVSVVDIMSNLWDKNQHEKRFPSILSSYSVCCIRNMNFDQSLEKWAAAEDKSRLQAYLLWSGDKTPLADISQDQLFTLFGTHDFFTSGKEAWEYLAKTRLPIKGLRDTKILPIVKISNQFDICNVERGEATPLLFSKLAAQYCVTSSNQEEMKYIQDVLIAIQDLADYCWELYESGLATDVHACYWPLYKTLYTLISEYPEGIDINSLARLLQMLQTLYSVLSLSTRTLIEIYGHSLRLLNASTKYLIAYHSVVDAAMNIFKNNETLSKGEESETPTYTFFVGIGHDMDAIAVCLFSNMPATKRLIGIQLPNIGITNHKELIPLIYHEMGHQIGDRHRKERLECLIDAFSALLARIPFSIFATTDGCDEDVLSVFSTIYKTALADIPEVLSNRKDIIDDLCKGGCAADIRNEINAATRQALHKVDENIAKPLADKFKEGFREWQKNADKEDIPRQNLFLRAVHDYIKVYVQDQGDNEFAMKEQCCKAFYDILVQLSLEVVNITRKHHGNIELACLLTECICEREEEYLRHAQNAWNSFVEIPQRPFSFQYFCDEVRSAAREIFADLFMIQMLGMDSTQYVSVFHAHQIKDGYEQERFALRLYTVFDAGFDTSETLLDKIANLRENEDIRATMEDNLIAFKRCGAYEPLKRYARICIDHLKDVHKQIKTKDIPLLEHVRGYYNSSNDDDAYNNLYYLWHQKFLNRADLSGNATSQKRDTKILQSQSSVV